jgi:hypothetical protein
MIKCYAANGSRLRDRSVASVETLASLGKVSVTRHRRTGTIIGCQFKSEALGANPILKSAHMGQSYSFEQHLPSGHTCWKHRALLQSQAVEALFGDTVESRNAIDRYIKSVYMNVALSVIVESPRTAPAPAASASNKVVNIADFEHLRQPSQRKATGPARPIEFDSQLRRHVA